jgi:hypothetical protein
MKYLIQKDGIGMFTYDLKEEYLTSAAKSEAKIYNLSEKTIYDAKTTTWKQREDVKDVIEDIK